MCEDISRRSSTPIFVNNVHSCNITLFVATPFPSTYSIDDTFDVYSDTRPYNNYCAAANANGKSAYCASCDTDCFCVGSIYPDRYSSFDCYFGRHVSRSYQTWSICIVCHAMQFPVSLETWSLETTIFNATVTFRTLPQFRIRLNTVPILCRTIPVTNRVIKWRSTVDCHFETLIHNRVFVQTLCMIMMIVDLCHPSAHHQRFQIN